MRLTTPICEQFSIESPVFLAGRYRRVLDDLFPREGSA